MESYKGEGDLYIKTKKRRGRGCIGPLNDTKQRKLLRLKMIITLQLDMSVALQFLLHVSLICVPCTETPQNNTSSQ